MRQDALDFKAILGCVGKPSDRNHTQMNFGKAYTGEKSKNYQLGPFNLILHEVLEHGGGNIGITGQGLT